MKWITEKDIEDKIKTKQQAIEKSIHHWLQLSIASLDDFKEAIAGNYVIPMDGEECALCEYAHSSEQSCKKCPLYSGDSKCCPEYENVVRYRDALEDNLDYKNKRKFQNAAKKLLIRLLKIKYKEG